MTNQDPSLQPEQEVATEEWGLKYKIETELLDHLLQSGEGWSEDQRAMVLAAYNFASEIHNGQSHRNGAPYTYHLLRNANRVTSYLHIYDPEVVVGVLLHDSVEDHPDKIILAGFSDNGDGRQEFTVPEDPLAQQELALHVLSRRFTPRVAELVSIVTNPPLQENEGLSYEEQLQKYEEIVEKDVETWEGWVEKFVDVVDNALGIVHSSEPSDSKLNRHLSVKYGKVIRIFEARFRQPDIQALLDYDAKRYVEHQLSSARKRLVVT